MSEKNLNNTENLNDSMNENDNLSSADKILKKIKDKQNIGGIELNEELVIKDTVQELETVTNELVTETEESVSEHTELKEVVSEVEETEEIIEVSGTDEVSEVSDIIDSVQEIETETSEIVEEDKTETDENANPDYSGKSKTELISILNEITNTDKITNFIKGVRVLKDEFYTILNSENEERKNKFIEDGGNPIEYEAIKDVDETTFNELYRKFNEKKEAILKKSEEEKKKNLEQKYAVIKEIDDLINKPESFNKTFNYFKDLQKRWNSIGPVPKNDYKDLFDEYNKQVQKFYDYLDVNKELRELDFKKNLEAKIELCEKAEELLLESNYNKAKKELQTLHKKWKDTGSLSNENREEVWKRFQSATIKINENFSEYIEEIKVQQDKNLESKQFLVLKAKEYAETQYTNHKEWKDASVQVVELQKLWKKIGYVPKEHNNEIYTDFKNVCDSFFVRIREYYDESEKDKDDNYQKKLDLCVQAESLKDSNEWNNTSEIYKQIQNEWKKIGPVSKKHSDEVWKRFRTACNVFFDRKKEYFKDKKVNEKDNLILKQEIIKKIIEFDFSENQMDNLKQLKELQNEFLAVGYVPFDQKDEVYKQFHNAIDTQLGKLNISKEKQSEMKFNESIKIIKNSPGSDRLAFKELIKLQNQIETINDDIRIWENNIGFFSGSKKSESMIQNIYDKIEAAKSKVELLKKNKQELENIND